MSRGYASREYGQSFSEYGNIVRLPRSGLQLIKRTLEGHYYDLLGLYPYSCASNWQGLAEDIEEIAHTGAVSIALVADPFEEGRVISSIGDWHVCRPFKTHWVVQVDSDWRARCTKNVRRHSRIGLQLQDTTVVKANSGDASEFWRLYRQMADNRGFSGIQRLSAQAIRQQLALKECYLVSARDAESLTGSLILIENDVATSMHLMAIEPRARRLSTSYALIYSMLEHQESRGRSLVNLGGAAGLTDNPNDGLYQFKKRWAGTSRNTLFGGRIIDKDAYDRFVKRAGAQHEVFFPAYRAPGSAYHWAPVPAG